MTNTIEIEMRGLLHENEIIALRERLLKIGVLKTSKRRVLVDYSTFLPEQGVAERTIDIRIRNTNGKSEIIIKTGKWGGADARQEHIVTTDTSFDELANVMCLLGYKKGVLCVRNSEIFQVGEIEFALVEVPSHSYYFEAEIEVTDSTIVAGKRALLINFLTELSLEVFTDQQFYDYIERLNTEANTVYQADLTEHFFKAKFNI